MSDNNSNVGPMLIAFATGAIIGAGIALLYAPQSGEETRRMIAEKAEELKKQAMEKYEAGKDVLREKKEHLAAAYEAGKEGYREAKARSGSSES